MEKQLKNIKILYFAALKDDANKAEEQIYTSAESLRDLFRELGEKYLFSLHEDNVKAAVNHCYREMSANFASGDEIAFIPPVTGG
jgi:molybdopterin synthase sulfur carrier subunit